MKAIAFLPSSSNDRAEIQRGATNKTESRSRDSLILPFYSLNTGAATTQAASAPTERHSVFECFWFK